MKNDISLADKLHTFTGIAPNIIRKEDAKEMEKIAVDHFLSILKNLNWCGIVWNMYEPPNAATYENIRNRVISDVNRKMIEVSK